MLVTLRDHRSWRIFTMIWPPLGREYNCDTDNSYQYVFVVFVGSVVVRSFKSLFCKMFECNFERVVSDSCFVQRRRISQRLAKVVVFRRIVRTNPRISPQSVRPGRISRSHARSDAENKNGEKQISENVSFWATTLSNVYVYQQAYAPVHGNLNLSIQLNE